tara:strand:+ start:438 stop:554 length:117 start_codon:yes stop_codon:yes gene_type:complete
MEKDTKLGLAILAGAIIVPVIGGAIVSYLAGLGEHPLE